MRFERLLYQYQGPDFFRSNHSHKHSFSFNFFSSARVRESSVRTLHPKVTLADASMIRDGFAAVKVIVFPTIIRTNSVVSPTRTVLHDRRL
jgi:hypothetical protein